MKIVAIIVPFHEELDNDCVKTSVILSMTS